MRIFVALVSLVVIVFVGALFLRVLVGWRRLLFRRRQKTSVLAIKVAKTNEAGPIVAEQIFATLHGFYHKLSWFDVLHGKEQYTVSFEIAMVERQMKFYVWFPTRLRTLIEGQIYAQYPDADIEEVPDYMERINPADAVTTNLHLTDPVIYPIRRFTQFEDKLARTYVDPLSSITATMAQLPHSNDSAAVQCIVRPLAPAWRIIYLKCLRIVAKGVFANIESLKKAYIRTFTTRSSWIKLMFFPLYIYFWFRGLFSGMKHAPLLLSAEQNSDESDLREEVSERHDRESEQGAAFSKIAKLLFECSIRILYSPHRKANARPQAEREDEARLGLVGSQPSESELMEKESSLVKIREIAGSYKQFEIPHLNGLEMSRINHGQRAYADFKTRKLDATLVFNTEELATLYHLPHQTVGTPNIVWVRSRKLAPPSDLPAPADDGTVTLLGQTNHRGTQHDFGIKQNDRRRHIYIIGKTGMGKSTLLENMIFSDIQNGKGLAVVDPHGDLADRVLDFVPSHRTNDVVLFDPSDREYPVGFNMLENIDPAYSTIVASGLIGIFKKMYAESWGPRLEHILRNTILSLLEYPNTTMLGITRMLQDADYRRRVIKKISDPIVKGFWVSEFEKMEPRLRVEAISPILNKVGQFLSTPIIRNIVGQVQSTVNLRMAMDKKKIVIVNLSKGKIGEDTSSLLGAMIITKFQLDAMSRANLPESERVDFYLYVDEFQNFATESFATILSEARKYRLNLTMANQYIAQMPEEVRDAVFGNVGSLITFQVGFDDAEVVAGQFGGDETMVPDLVGLNLGNTYTRLLIDGMPTEVFSMSTFPPPQLAPESGRREKILKFCRERYSTAREVIEDKIRRWASGVEVEQIAS